MAKQPNKAPSPPAQQSAGSEGDAPRNSQRDPAKGDASQAGIRVQISTSPAGASVFVSDENTGQKTPASVIFPEPGEYVVQLRLAGYKDRTEKIRVLRGKGQEFPFTLAQALRGGKVSVTAIRTVLYGGIARYKGAVFPMFEADVQERVDRGDVARVEPVDATAE